MAAGLSIHVLGTLRGGVFSPCPAQPCFCFQGDRVAIGARAWSCPALVLRDSSVSPRHATVERNGASWVVQDLESDNGIRPVSFSPDSDRSAEDGAPASRLEFTEEMCCCVGAVVVRLEPLE